MYKFKINEHFKNSGTGQVLGKTRVRLSIIASLATFNSDISIAMIILL